MQPRSCRPPTDTTERRGIFALAGRRGWTYKLAGLASKYMSAPEIVIADEAGATIHVGVCERLKHSWTIPEGLRGKFGARPKLRVTGFDHEAKPLTVEIR